MLETSGYSPSTTTLKKCLALAFTPDEGTYLVSAFLFEAKKHHQPSSLMIQVHDSLSLELLSQASIELTDHSKMLANVFSLEDDIKVEFLFHR